MLEDCLSMSANIQIGVWLDSKLHEGINDVNLFKSKTFISQSIDIRAVLANGHSKITIYIFKHCIRIVSMENVVQYHIL